jgi:hypothetical protein
MGEELANAKQAIGHYMCAYSDAAFELGETLKVLFGIKDKPMADAIVVALVTFLVRSTSRGPCVKMRAMQMVQSFPKSERNKSTRQCRTVSNVTMIE